jgi:hypothetical protein
MFSAYFCYFRSSRVDYNCSLIKVDGLDACFKLRVGGAVLVVFSSRVGVKFAQSSSQWKQGPIPEELSQTLLTNKNNKKQGNLK